MSKMAFAFDLHNTLMCSNDAWIDAYIEIGGTYILEQVTEAVYRKKNRKEIANAIGVDYVSVYNAYCRKVLPYKNMLCLLKQLKQHYPIYLISAASAHRVYKDLSSWHGELYFDLILTKENFHKGHQKDWDRLICEKELELLIYIGNDVEEDIVISEQVIPLISGNFLHQLDCLSLLIDRGE